MNNQPRAQTGFSHQMTAGGEVKHGPFFLFLHQMQTSQTDTNGQCIAAANGRIFKYAQDKQR